MPISSVELPVRTRSGGPVALVPPKPSRRFRTRGHIVAMRIDDPRFRDLRTPLPYPVPGRSHEEIPLRSFTSIAQDAPMSTTGETAAPAPHTGAAA